jgi:hypothetical protein
MDLSVTGWEGTDWIHIIQNRDCQQALINTIIDIQVP